ncbi:Uncharacterised protein, partial [Mycoplasmopsis edwardii]
MDGSNYKDVRKEIIKLGFETKEAFSRLITYTFGGSYFKNLMTQGTNSSLNNTITW